MVYIVHQKHLLMKINEEGHNGVKDSSNPGAGEIWKWGKALLKGKKVEIWSGSPHPKKRW